MKYKLSDILTASFMLLLLLIIAIESALDDRSLNAIANITQDLYEHPFTVSNSILKINLSITQMHRDMKDIALASSLAELERSAALVNDNETQVLNTFKIVSNRFLGDAKIIADAKLAFINWKPIRDRVINLKRQGKDRQAALITKNEGAAYIKNLLLKMSDLSDFANYKAKEYVELSIVAKKKDGLYLTIISFLALILGFFLAVLASTRTRSDSNKLKIYADEKEAYANKLEHNLSDSLHAIALTVEQRDPYTAGHMTRVSELAAAIARKLALSDDEIHGISLGAAIHDLGKIYIPSEILTRPGKLLPMGFEIIKSHSQVGYDILKDIDFPWPISDMVLYHHERLDGSGYPRGLKGDEIPYEAQILAVADVVEAVSSPRPYRASLGIDKALAVIKKGEGQHYNAEIVDACVDLFEKDGFVFTSEF